MKKIISLIYLIFLLFSCVEEKKIESNDMMDNNVVKVIENNDWINENIENKDNIEKKYYLNEKLGFQFMYPNSWEILKETNNIAVEWSIIIPKLYLQIKNTNDFKVRNFDIDLMIITEEESKMPWWMVFDETIKIIKNNNWENIYISIIANSIMWGDFWNLKELEVEKDTNIFKKDWNIIIDSIKPIKIITNEELKQENNLLPKYDNTNLSIEEKYCVDNWGEIWNINECNQNVPICILDDGTDCPITDFLKGSCVKWVIVEWGEECR